MEHLDSRLFMAGMATPSPTPMHARANKRAGRPKLAARGVKTVAMLHQMTPKPSTVLPPYLSAHTPPATCVVKYPLSRACLSISRVAGTKASVCQLIRHVVVLSNSLKSLRATLFWASLGAMRGVSSIDPGSKQKDASARIVGQHNLAPCTHSEPCIAGI